MVDLKKPCPRCGKPDPGNHHVPQCATLPDGVDPDTVMLDVTLENGKYRLIYHLDAKHPQAFRHGEPWPAFSDDMLGSQVICALVMRVAELEEQIASPEKS